MDGWMDDVFAADATCCVSSTPPISALLSLAPSTVIIASSSSLCCYCILCRAVASQPINEGGQSPGAPRSKGPPSATCKNSDVDFIILRICAHCTVIYTTIHDGLCLQFCNLSLIKI